MTKPRGTPGTLHAESGEIPFTLELDPSIATVRLRIVEAKPILSMLIKASPKSKGTHFLRAARLRLDAAMEWVEAMECMERYGKEEGSP